MKKIVSIFIVSTKGDLLLHHKDDISSDNSGGIISGFEGPIKPGEAAIGSAVRELREQAGLEVRSDDLEFLDTYRELGDSNEAGVEASVFVLAGLDEDRIHVYQGMGLWTIHRSDDFNDIPMSATTRKQVIDYFRRHKKW